MLNPRQIRILVVDDERAIRELLASRFAIFGFQSLQAEDGKAAWSMICADTSIKIVITDLVMPNLDGKELLKLCRSAHPEFPRIFTMTGQSNWPIEELYALGADGFLLKPFDARTLLNISRNSLLTLEERLRYPPYKKSAATINLQFPSLEAAYQSGHFALGRGGLFVQVPGTLPAAGENLDLKIKLGSLLLDGVGILRWQRPGPKGTTLAGLEFAHLDNPCIDAVQKIMRDLQSATFIPSPQTPASIPSTAKLQSTG